MFLCKVNSTEVKYEMVPEEVCEVAWVAKEDMESFLENKTKEDCLFSPWFMKMFKNGLLYQWWDNAISNKLADVGSEDETPVRDL